MASHPGMTCMWASFRFCRLYRIWSADTTCGHDEAQSSGIRAEHLQSYQGRPPTFWERQLPSPQLTEQVNGLYCTFALCQSSNKSTRGRCSHLRSKTAASIRLFKQKNKTRCMLYKGHKANRYFYIAAFGHKSIACLKQQSLLIFEKRKTQKGP